MALKGNLKPGKSSFVKLVLESRERRLSLLSSMIIDVVLTRRGSWSTIILDNRAVPTSSMSFSVSLETFSLCKAKCQLQLARRN